MADSAGDDGIKLDGLEFWQLRALASEAVRARIVADCATQTIEARQAERRAIEVLDMLAKKYGFDASRDWAFEESSLSLMPVASETPPKP